MSSTLTSTLSLLITANHILDHYGLVDGFGHVSVRSPDDPSTFFMTGNVPAGFVSGEGDLAHYHVEDGSPVNPRDGTSNTSPWSERFCHSGILKLYPEVTAVVHSHSQPVTAIGVSNVRVQAMYHMAGFLGDSVPVFDIRNFYEEAAPQNLLVNSNKLGADLASTLSTAAANAGGPNRKPEHTVTLQRGHGFTTWGTSLQEVVYRAVYTQENAKIQLSVSGLSNTLQSDSDGRIAISLSTQEIADCGVMNRASAFKAWAYWSRIVEANPLCQNLISNARNTKTDRDYWSRTEGKIVSKAGV